MKTITTLAETVNCIDAMFNFLQHRFEFIRKGSLRGRQWRYWNNFGGALDLGIMWVSPCDLSCWTCFTLVVRCSYPSNNIILQVNNQDRREQCKEFIKGGNKDVKLLSLMFSCGFVVIYQQTPCFYSIEWT